MILTTLYKKSDIKMPLAALVNVNRMTCARNSSDTDGNNIPGDRSKLEEATKCKMIENFAFVITVIERVDMDAICLEFEIECILYHRLRGFLRAEEILLKILEKEADVCYRFKEYLLRTDQKKKINGIMRPLGNDIPISFKEKYKDVAVQNFIQIHEYLVVNLEVKPLLIPLLESGVLPLEKYTTIRNLGSLEEKKRNLMSFLIERSDSVWLIRFLYVLHKTHQTDVLTYLKTGDTPEITDDLAVAMGRTNIILKATEIPNRSAEDINNISELELDMSILDIRRGSIVLRLQTRSEMDFCVFVYSNHRLEQFFQRMYSNLKLEKSEKRLICVTIQHIPKHEFIQYRTSQNDEREIDKIDFQKDGCPMCLQEIVRSNVKTIVAEIESDIIAQTFDKIPEITEFTKNICMNKQTTPSRQQRAIKFLSYALHDEKCLCTFYKIFTSTSNCELYPATCQKCLSNDALAMEPDLLMEKLQEVAMNFVLFQENGQIIVKYAETPSPTSTSIFQLTNKFSQISSEIINSREYQQKHAEVGIKEKPRQKQLQNTDRHTVSEKSLDILRENSNPNLCANWMQENMRVLDILEEQSEEILKVKDFIDCLSCQNIQLQEGIRNMMTAGMHFRGGNAAEL